MRTSNGDEHQQGRRARARTGRDAPLTRDEITATALRAAERGELDAMTMRSLADELGVTAMALYSHVANKDESSTRSSMQCWRT